MSLNDVKFELLRYGRNQQLKKETTYKTPSGKIITTKKDVKDLGVIMSDSGLFRNHIDNVVEKAKNLTSWILRAFKTRDFIP